MDREGNGVLRHEACPFPGGELQRFGNILMCSYKIPVTKLSVKFLERLI